MNVVSVWQHRRKLITQTLNRIMRENLSGRVREELLAFQRGYVPRCGDPFQQHVGPWGALLLVVLVGLLLSAAIWACTLA